MSKLAALFADLYNDKDKTRSFLREARLDEANIDLEGASKIRWEKILEEARKRDRLKDLVELASKDFGTWSGDLENALKEYRSAQGGPAPEPQDTGKLTPKHLTHPPDVTRPAWWKRWWWIFMIPICVTIAIIIYMFISSKWRPPWTHSRETPTQVESRHQTVQEPPPPPSQPKPDGEPNVLPGDFLIRRPVLACSGLQPTVQLSWSSSQGADSYQVSRRDRTAEQAAPNRSFLDQNVSADTRYVYTVSALNWTGKTPKSISIRVPRAFCSPPGDCRLSAFLPVQGSIQLRWSSSAGATAYDVMRDGVTLQAHVTQALFDDPDRSNLGTSRTYSIVANNDNAHLNRMCSAPTVLPGEFTLQQPTVSCNAGRPIVNLNWSASDNAGNYVVKRDEAAISLNIPGNSFADQNAQVLMAYHYYVEAHRERGITRSNEVTIAPTICDVHPPPPLIVLNDRRPGERIGIPSTGGYLPPGLKVWSGEVEAVKPGVYWFTVSGSDGHPQRYRVQVRDSSDTIREGRLRRISKACTPTIDGTLRGESEGTLFWLAIFLGERGPEKRVPFNNSVNDDSAFIAACKALMP